MKRLAANLAVQVPDIGFFVEGDGDGVFVVAEEALEDGVEFLFLYNP